MGKILIIEDEWLIAENNKLLLENLGYEVIGIASDQESAFDQINKSVPNLILMDIMLSGKKDGIDVAMTIQKHWDIPIIYTSAYSGKEILERAKLSGPYGYIIKPYTDRELHSAIEMALYKHRTNQQLSQLNTLLNIIRGINQLIIKTREVQPLLKGICNVIANSPEYEGAWVALLDNEKQVSNSWQSGKTEQFEIWNDKFLNGKVPDCIDDLLSSKDLLKVQGKSDCADCIVADKFKHDILIAKLERNNQFQGIMGVAMAETTGIDVHELTLIEELAGDIAYAVHNIQLELKKQEVEKIQAALLKISQAAHLSEKDRDFYIKIKNSISVLMPVTNFYVAIYDESEDVLTFPYFQDVKETKLKPRKNYNGITEYVIKNGESICASKADFRQMIDQGKIDKLGTIPEFWLGVPLKWQNRTFGVMAVQSYKKDVNYGQAELEMLSFVADQLSGVINRRQDRETIVEKQQLLESLLNNLPDQIFLKDLSHRFQVCNSAVVRELNKKSINDVLGKTDLDFYDKESAEKYVAEEKEILNSGLSFTNREDISSNKDGTPKWNLSTKLPIYDSNDNIAGIVGINRDITEIKLAELKIEQLLNQQIQINELVLILGSIENLEEMYKAVYQKVSTLMDVNTFIISFYDPIKKEFSAEFARVSGDYMNASKLPNLPLEAPGKGGQSQVIHSGEAFYIPDLHQFQSLLKRGYTLTGNGKVIRTKGYITKDSYPQSSLHVPLKVDQNIIGVMQVQSNMLDGYRDSDIDLLQGMANVTAIAIQKRKLLEDVQYELLKRRTAESRERRLLEQQIAVNRLAMALGEATELKQVFYTAYTHFSQFSRVSGFEILRLMPTPKRLTAQFVIKSGKNLDPELLSSYLVRKNSNNIYIQILKTHESRVIENLPEYVEEYRKAEKKSGSTAMQQIPPQFLKLYPDARIGIWVPMRVKGEVVGVLQVNSTEANSFSARDFDQISAFTSVIAVAVENARLLEAQQAEIKERIRIQTELRNSEQRYRSLYEGVPVGYYRTNESGRFLEVNPVLVKLLRYPDANTLLKQNAENLYTTAERRKKWLNELHTNGFVRGFENQLKCFDGTQIWVLETANIVKDKKTGLIFYEGALEDISARKLVEMKLKDYQLHLEDRVEQRTRELQEKQIQLEQSGRLAALGDMAAGIAHEINQPLSIIQMQAELLNSELSTSSRSLAEKKNDIKLIQNQVQRASEIIEHLQEFTGLQPDYIDQIDPIELVSWNMDFYRKQFEALDIELAFEYNQKIPTVEVYPQDLEQILLNLISNARMAVEALDANQMKSPKKVGIKLDVDKRKQNFQIIVTDNGVGMSPAVLKRCQEPFYTTRDVGEGTGMGLAIVYFLVKRYSGTMNIKTSHGEGTQIIVKLPVNSET